MSRHGITQDQVFTTAQKMADTQQPVTVQAVRAALGVGSYTTVSQHLRHWREQRHHAVPATPLPAEVEAAAATTVATLWAAACEHAQRETDVIRQTAHAQVNAAQVQTQDALQEITRLEQELYQSAQQRAEQTHQLDAARQALNVADNRYAADQATLEQLNRRIAELKLELDQAQALNERKAEECGRLRGELASRPASPPTKARREERVPSNSS